MRVARRETPCRTLLSYAGSYQLTLDSAVAEYGVELHSCYLGQRQAGYLATSHLAIVTGQPARVFCAPDDSAATAVGEQRRDCLLHHFEQLRVLLAGASGGVVTIEVVAAALERMDDLADGDRLSS